MSNDKIQATLQKLALALQKSQEKIDSLTHEPIAIIGMGCRFPGFDNTLESYWRVLNEGVDTIIEIPKDRWDIEDYYDPDIQAPGKMYTRSGAFINNVDQFDADFFSISPREAQDLDPQARLMLEVSYEAMEHAGIAPNRLQGSDTGVFMGIMYDDYFRLLDQNADIGQISAYYDSGNLFSASVGRISFHFGFHGPCVPIDTACSSSLVAIHQACNSLRLGECRVALAGGVNLMLRAESAIMECKGNMLARDGHCKTFDASADGFARGEGCGVVVLKKLSDAIQDQDSILAVIKGSAVNHGGASSALTVPSGLAQEALMKSALENAKLEADDISYLEAHGTGTALGDPIEIRAIEAVYGKNRDKKNPLIISSVKTNIGHTESAAGVAGLIKVILALNHERIPKHLNLKKINPLINFDNIPAKIPLAPIAWPKAEKPRLAGISSFGFSGINAHLIVSEAPPMEFPVSKLSVFFLPISGLTEPATLAIAAQLKEFLEKNPSIDLASLAYTLQVGRQHFRYRAAIVCDTVSSAIAKLGTISVVKSPEESIIQKPLKFTDALSQTENPAVAMLVISKAWQKGERIDWESLYGENRPKKARIPTYPFQRKRHWHPFSESSSSSTENLERYFYKPEWEALDLSGNQKKISSCLVIGQLNSIAQAVKAEFEKNNIQIISIQSSDHLDEARALNFEAILFLPAYQYTQAKNSVGILELQNFSCRELIKLVEFLDSKNSQIPVFIPTKNAEECSQATIWGLMRVVDLEFPKLESWRIDLDPNFSETQAANILFKEIQEISTANQIAYRNGNRYALRIKRAKIPEKKALNFSENKTYLITGGLGEIGLELATWLISKGLKNLALTARNPPKENAMKRLAELREKGATIKVYLGDIADEPFVLELISQIQKEMPPLSGIIHAAGIINDHLLRNMAWEDFKKVLAPKIQGAFNLHRHTQSIPLDAFWLFSSISGFLGNPAQGNYAAANAYLDALAALRRNLGLPALSINWGAWEIGMWAKGGEKTASSEKAIRPMPAATCLQALEIAASIDDPQIMIADLDWSKASRVLGYSPDSYFFSEFRKDMLSESSVLSIADSKRPAFEVPELQYAKILSVIQAALSEILLQAPGSEIEIDTHFSKLGLDSLMAVNLRNTLQSAFSVNLPVGIAYEADTVESLAKYILREIAPSPTELQKEKFHSAWIIPQAGKDSAKINLFCFPHSGGGASAFRSWENYFPPEINLQRIQLPGREERSAEPLINNELLLLNELAQAIKPLLKKPYAFFGHSLGGLLAVDLALLLAAMNLPLPKLIIISGINANVTDAAFIESFKPIFEKDDASFAQIISDRFKGIPEGLIQNQGLLSVFLPIIKNDLSLILSRAHFDKKTLNVSLLTISSMEDLVNPENMRNWEKIVTGPHQHLELSGNHFALYEQVIEYTEAIIREVKKAIGEGL